MMRPMNYVYNGFLSCLEQRPNNLTFSQACAAKHSRWMITIAGVHELP